MTVARVLVHIEDPGAANFLLGVPARLAARGIAVDVLVDGFARTTLSGRSELAPYVRAETPEALFAGRCPDVVLTGTAENRASRAFELIARARAGGIVSAAVVDLPVNAADRFSGNSGEPLAHAPDLVLVADEATYDAFVALGVPAERLRRIRNPRFDAIEAARAQLERTDRTALQRSLFAGWDGRPILVFAAEPESALDPARSHDRGSFTLHGRGGVTWDVAIALEELLDALAARPPRPFVVLRLHPKNAPADFARYAGEVDAFSSGGDPLPVLCAADAIVGMGSMVLAEAAVLGRPVLALLPDPAYRARLPMIADGSIASCTERSAIPAALRALMDAPAALRGPRRDPAPAVEDVVLECVLARGRDAVT